MENSKDILEKGNIDVTESASLEAAARQEVLAENAKKRKARLIKLGAMLAMTAIVLVFVTIAWFTMNREVQTGSMAVKAGGSPFELEVRGIDTYIENKDDFSKADDDYEYGVDMETLDAFQTSGQYEKIIWRKTASSPSGTTSDDGHYAKGLEPNSHGKLTFWVVPNDTGTLDIEFDFNIRGFIGTFSDPEDEEDEPELTGLYEINDDLTVANSDGLIENASQLADKKAALEYIQGHILFFSDYNGTY